ncbi:hypothetical protein Q5752_000360 [Cryptotrichosporon argae]
MKVSTLIAAVAGAVPAQAYFILSQPVLETTRLDPIVFPGQVSAHVHAIAGGSNFAETQTYESMQEGLCTTAPVNIDKSNYWAPQLYYYSPDLDAFEMIPVSYMNAYYLPRAGSDGVVKAFPPGLRMISGNPYRRTFNASSPDDLAISYVCLDYSGSHTGDPAWDQRNSFFAHNCPSGMRAQVNFRPCWDGVNLDSDDHQSHMAWPSGGVDGGDCPDSHPVHLVSLFYEWIFEVQNFPFNNASYPTWVLAPGDSTGYAFHGDFISGWPEDINGTNVLQDAIDQCNADSGVGGELDNCPPFVPYLDTAAADACTPQNPLVDEDIGDGHYIALLPGDNPLYFNGTTATEPAAATATTPGLSSPSSTLPTGWNHTGCIAEGTSGRALTGASLSNANMTRAACASWCASRGFPLAGAEYADECYCGYALANGATNATLLDASSCSMKCASNTYETCGGSSTLDLFVNPALFPQPVALPAGWVAGSCMTEATSARALSGYSFTSSAMTPTLCIQTCQAKNYTLAGTEYADECYCGNSFNAGAVVAASTSCNMNCAGSASSVCGGSNRLTTYNYTLVANTSTSTTTKAASTVATTGTVTTSVNATATAANATVITTTAKANATVATTVTAANTTVTAVTVKANTTTATTVATTASTKANTTTASANRREHGAGVSIFQRELEQGSNIEREQGGNHELEHGGGHEFEQSGNAKHEQSGNQGGVEQLEQGDFDVVCQGDVYDQFCEVDFYDHFRKVNVFFLVYQAYVFDILCQGDLLGVVDQSVIIGALLDYKQPGGRPRQGCRLDRAVLNVHGQAVFERHILDCVVDCPLELVVCPSELDVRSSELVIRPLQLVVCPELFVGSLQLKLVVGSLQLVVRLPELVRPLELELGPDARTYHHPPQASLLFSSTSMTTELCISTCQSRGYIYAGTEYAHQCFCGSALTAGYTNATASSCNMACAGNSAEKCGAASLISLYISANATKTYTLPTNWTSVGCYTEASSGRALASYSFTSSSMTPALCINKCAAQGYIYAGTEYADECYCADSIASTATTATSGCSMTCAGDNSVMCGGSNRLSVYKSDQPLPDETLPSNWTSMGCYTEATSGRALSSYSFTSSAMTPKLCVDTCNSKGYYYAGTEYSTECYCGDALQSGSIAASSGCTMVCGGDKSTACGGSSLLNIYKSAATVPAAVVPTGWTALGCYSDSSSRTLDQDAYTSSSAMTWASCTAFCATGNYTYAGIEDGTECYCANSFSNGGAPVAASGCSAYCSGSANEACGGSWTLNVFQVANKTTTTTSTTKSRRRSRV